MLQGLSIFHNTGLAIFSWRSDDGALKNSPNTLIDTFLLEGHTGPSFTIAKSDKNSSTTHLRYDAEHALVFVADFAHGTPLERSLELMEKVYTACKTKIVDQLAHVQEKHVDTCVSIASRLAGWRPLVDQLQRPPPTYLHHQPTCQLVEGEYDVKGRASDKADDFPSLSESKSRYTDRSFSVRVNSAATEKRSSQKFDRSPAKFAHMQHNRNDTQLGECSGDPSASLNGNGSWLARFSRTTSFQNFTGRRSLRDDDLTNVLAHLKAGMLRKNVASSSADLVCNMTRATLLGSTISATETMQSALRNAVRRSLRRILMPVEEIDLISRISTARAIKKPYVIVFIGVNGVGKSTSLSKVANWLLANNVSVLVSACDTFRAGAVEQLRTHCQRLEVPLYERGYQKDPAVIAQEAVTQAKRQGLDVVLIDTAGRMQDNEPLMRALSKLIDINSPDLVLFVGEALVGNEAVDQLEKFNAALQDFDRKGRKRLIDAILISKFDTIDDKVGAALSMVHASGAPILFVGCGQTYQDLCVPNVENLIESLLS